MVVGKGAGLEAPEPMVRRVDGQALEQGGRETAAVKCVVDGERHFGDRGVDRHVRGECDRPQVVGAEPVHAEREGLAGIARVRHPVDDRVGRL